MYEVISDDFTKNVRRNCGSSNSSDTSSEDALEDSGRVPLLHGTTSRQIGEQTVIDISQSDCDIKSTSSLYDKYPNEPVKAMVAISLLVIAVISNYLVLSFIHDRVPEQPPLPDIVFSLTQYIPSALFISEYLMLILFVTMLILTIFHKHRWIILRRISFIASLLYFGRCVTMFVTQVPIADANYYCAPKLTPENATLWNITLRALRVFRSFGMKISGENELCGDYIYSGHTLVLVTSWLFIKEYSPRSWKLLHLVSMLVSLVGVIFLLISRGHYTIDVVISYWISTRVFWIYHTMAAYPSLKNMSSHHNHFTKFYWFRLFYYMECNVHKPLPRKFNWPFPIFQWKRRSALSLLKSNTL